MRTNCRFIAGSILFAAMFCSMPEAISVEQGTIVVQGMDDVVPEGGTALLEGSATFSEIGPIISYSRTQVGGPLVTLINPTGEVALFQAPIVDEDTLLLFRLEASDGIFTGADDDVRIIVTNLRTTAVAGVDRSVEEGSHVRAAGIGATTRMSFRPRARVCLNCPQSLDIGA